VSRYKLVIVPDETEVPEAVVSTVLTEGTGMIEVLAHWSMTAPDRKFSGGIDNFKMAVPGV
jgi:hypothetical protein